MLLAGLIVAALLITSCFPLKSIPFNFKSSFNMLSESEMNAKHDCCFKQIVDERPSKSGKSVMYIFDGRFPI